MMGDIEVWGSRPLKFIWGFIERACVRAGFIARACNGFVRARVTVLCQRRKEENTTSMSNTVQIII